MSIGSQTLDGVARVPSPCKATSLDWARESRSVRRAILVRGMIIGATAVLLLGLCFFALLQRGQARFVPPPQRGAAVSAERGWTPLSGGSPALDLWSVGGDQAICISRSQNQ